MDTLRRIGWNSVCLSCPADWEGIVSGDTHLLFEKDFHPVFELRWERAAKRNSDSIKTTLTHIAKESGLSECNTLPPHWKALQKTYAVKLLANNDSGDPCAAILICKECGTTLLLYFFTDFIVKHHWELSRLLSSIECHDLAENKTCLWTIQDFQIHLPKTFQLTGYNFGAGLTRISFAYSGLTMHLCRLAGASHQLQKTSMSKLLNVLGDIDIDEEQIQHKEDSVSHSSTPSIFHQIRCRLKRKLPFHRVTLRHHPEHDRLSGLFFFDKKPISSELTQTITESYEILPLSP